MPLLATVGWVVSDALPHDFQYFGSYFVLRSKDRSSILASASPVRSSAATAWQAGLVVVFMIAPSIHLEIDRALFAHRPMDHS